MKKQVAMLMSKQLESKTQKAQATSTEDEQEAYITLMVEVPIKKQTKGNSVDEDKSTQSKGQLSHFTQSARMPRPPKHD